MRGCRTGEDRHSVRPDVIDSSVHIYIIVEVLIYAHKVRQQQQTKKLRKKNSPMTCLKRLCARVPSTSDPCPTVPVS
jgi:hypothetical protein